MAINGTWKIIVTKTSKFLSRFFRLTFIPILIFRLKSVDEQRKVMAGGKQLQAITID